MKLLGFIRSNILYLILFIFGALFLFNLPIDPDFGWHYKYGEHLVRDKEILRTDIFSYTMTGYPWENSYVLMQVYLYVFYNILGSAGLGIFSTVLLSFFTVLIMSKRPGSKISHFFGTIFLTLILWNYNISSRPMLFSTISLLFLVYSLLYMKKNIYFFPLLFLIWVNSHADFVLGVAILGVYASFVTVRSILKSDFKFFLRDTIVPLLTLLVTFINPYGYKLWIRIVMEALPGAPSQKYIAEFSPVKFNTPFYYILVTSAALCIYYVFFSLKGKQLPSWYKAIFLIFLPLAIDAGYFVRVLSIIAVFPLSDCVEYMCSYVSNYKNNPNVYKILSSIRTVSIGVFISAFIATLVVFLRIVGMSSDISRWAHNYRYPEKAIAFIKDNDLKGNMFNWYVWGGYLIWRLPEHKTFVDGRMPSWVMEGNSVFLDFKLCENAEDFNTLVWKYNLSWGLVPTDVDLIKDLIARDMIDIIYEDEVSVVFRVKGS